MAVENFQNTTTAGASSSTVSNVGGYTASDTAIDVADATKYPDPVFRLVNERTGELLRVTGKAADTLTVERGAEGTTAAAMNDADTLTCVLTRDSLQAVATNPIGDEGLRSQGVYLMVAHRDTDQLAYLMTSLDGKSWVPVKNSNLFTPASGKQRDPSILYHAGAFWVAHTNASIASPNSTTFTVIKSHDLLNWSKVVDVDCSGTGGTKTWAPEWFVEDDGTVRVLFAGGSTSPGDMQIYYVTATADDLSTWTAQTAITVTGEVSVIDPFVAKVGSTYNLWYKTEPDFYVLYGTSSTFGGPYTPAVSADWAGWGDNIEGQSLVKVDADTWRIYLVNNSGSVSAGVYYSESTDGWATWTAKALVTAPWLTSHQTVLRLRDFPSFRTVLAAKLQDAGTLSGGGGFALPSGTAISLGGLTWVNQGAATATAQTSGLWVSVPTSTDNVRALVKAKPAAPKVITVTLRPLLHGQNFAGAGIVVRDSATGKLATWMVHCNTTAWTKVSVDRFTSPSVFGSNTLSVTGIGFGAPVWALRLTDDGTNFKYSFSTDGTNFLQVLSESRTAYLASPDQWGVGVFNNNATYTPGCLFVGMDET